MYRQAPTWCPRRRSDPTTPRFSIFQDDLSFAAIEDIELQPIIVLIVRLPHERLQPFLVQSGARATAPLTPADGPFPAPGTGEFDG